MPGVIQSQLELWARGRAGRRFTCSSNFDLLSKKACFNLNKTRHCVKRLCGSQTIWKPWLTQVKWDDMMAGPALCFSSCFISFRFFLDFLHTWDEFAFRAFCHSGSLRRRYFNPNYHLFLKLAIRSSLPKTNQTILWWQTLIVDFTFLITSMSLNRGLFWGHCESLLSFT